MIGGHDLGRHAVGLPPPWAGSLCVPGEENVAALRRSRRSDRLEQWRQLLGMAPRTKSSCDTATPEDYCDRYERLTGRSLSHGRNFGRGFCHLLPDPGRTPVRKLPHPGTRTSGLTLKSDGCGNLQCPALCRGFRTLALTPIVPSDVSWPITRDSVLTV